MSLLSVTAAQIITRFLDTYLVPASGMLLLCSLMLIGWYGGVRPGLLAMALTLLAFKYYLANPIHSLTVKTSEIPRLLIFSLALVPLSVMAQTPGATPRTIRVVMDNAYAPYSFQTADGKLQGILIDQWRAWEKKTGIKAEIQAMDWDEALRRMRAGEFDVIDSIVETAERRNYFDFTPAYATVESSIYFRRDISGISDLASLKGFPVGVQSGDQHIDKLKENGVTTVIPFPNYDAISEAAKQHQINVFLGDDPSALYALNKMGMDEEFRRSPPVFRDELRRAVRKGDAATLRIVSDGFAAIAPGELKQIDEKWFGRTINRYGRYLTYVAYVAAVAILLIVGLLAWNRTLRKRILQRTAALGESEQRFRQIAENIREVFWLSTADFGSVLYISPAYESVWGRTCESLYQDPRSFIDGIHPEDRASVVDVIDRFREQGFEVEYRVVRPDGSIRWIRDRAFPIKDESGRFYRIAGIAEDISERKRAEDALRQSEDRLRLVVDTIPAMVFTALPDGSVDFVNQRWLQYLGLSLEDVQGWGWGPTIHPEDRSRSIDHWRSMIAAGQSAENELRVRRADGVYRWILGRFVPLRDESGQIIKWYGVSTDIDDRKQAEDALRRSEDRIRLIIDTIPTMAWSLGPDGVLDYVNQRWLDYTGLSRKEAIEEPTRTVHPEDLSRAMEKWLLVKATSEAYEDEMRLQRADGEYRWFLIRIAPLLDEQGNVLKRYGASIDIEDRKRVEEALKESQRKLEEAQRIAHVGHWDRDLETGRITWSDEMYRILGLPLEERDSSRTEWLDIVHPEDRQRVSLAIEEMQRGIRRFDVEFRIVRPNGEVRFIHSQGDVICDERGRPLRRFGTAQDITERKQAEDALRRSEDRLRLVIDTIPTMAWSLQPNGAIDFVNQRWMDYTGLSFEEAIAEPTRTMHPEDLSGAMAKWAANMADGEPFEGEMRLRQADGEYRWFLVRTDPLRDEQGNLVKWYGASIDIEDRKQAEQKLTATSEQLRALSARLQSAREAEGTRIAREIHDELGSALTSLKWDLEGMEKSLSDPKRGRDFESMKKKAETMTRLVDSTIDVVRRISAELRPSVLDDLGLVPAIEWQAQQFQDRTGIAVHCDCLLDDVDLDHEQSTAVFRIFQESLTNVLRHSRATRVDVTMVEKDDAFVLTIRDNGRGITEGEKFAQSSIGLLGMRERAHLIGGEIEITGIEGKGTTVTVRLPL